MSLEVQGRLFCCRLEYAACRTEGWSRGNCEATKREARVPSPVTVATHLLPHSGIIPEHRHRKHVWGGWSKREKERVRGIFFFTVHQRPPEKKNVFQQVLILRWGFCSLPRHENTHMPIPNIAMCTQPKIWQQNLAHTPAPRAAGDSKVTSTRSLQVITSRLLRLELIDLKLKY